MTESLKPFEFFNHAAGIGMTVRGATLPELFQNAALGLMSAIVDLETASPGGIRERVRAEALDKETLLVNWLNEILFLHNVQQMVFCGFQIRSFSETSIEAEGDGELLDPVRHGLLRQVKTTASHDLKIEQLGGFWSARIIFEF